MRLALLPLVFLLACDSPLPRGLSAPREPQVAESCDPADLYLAPDKTPALAKNTGQRFDVLPGVSMPPHVAARVARIDEKFAHRTGKHLLVVSGTRDPARQARAMIRVIQLGQSLTKLYEDREAALEIKQAYDRAVAARKTAPEVVGAVQVTIESQISRGTYISAHLRAGAVDIRNTTMTEAEKKAFRAAVRDTDSVSLLEEHRPPHYHLEIDPPERD